LNFDSSLAIAQPITPAPITNTSLLPFTVSHLALLTMIKRKDMVVL
jgi:hypothetical protein